MVVLRKEIKMGIGAGLAILGIAGVYGLMASLSSSHDQTAQVIDGQSGNDPLHGAISGLPPIETADPAPTKTPDTVKVPDPGQKADPFSEGVRTDGSKVDVWSSALSTGRIGDVSNTAPRQKETMVDRAPVGPKVDSKLVNSDTSLVDPKSPKRESSTPKAEYAGGTKYTIQPGDTFSTISEKVYGSRKFFNVLVKANPDVNPSRMKVGREITVPSKDAVASVGGSIEPAAGRLSTPIDATRQYRIAPGDTLSKIASKLYGRSTMWQAIYEANKTAIGPDEARLKVGTVLSLPEKPVR